MARLRPIPGNINAQVSRNIGWIVLALTAGCARGQTELSLANSPQRLPMPQFIARDTDSDGQEPNFSRIRVYELNDRCTGESCPIMWDVTVAEDRSPSQFVYGGFPGFGANAVLSARPLEPNRRYLLVTLPTSGKQRDGRGEFRFRVTPQGEVLPD